MIYHLPLILHTWQSRTWSTGYLSSFWGTEESHLLNILFFFTIAESSSNGFSVFPVLAHFIPVLAHFIPVLHTCTSTLHTHSSTLHTGSSMQCLGKHFWGRWIFMPPTLKKHPIDTQWSLQSALCSRSIIYQYVCDFDPAYLKLPILPALCLPAWFNPFCSSAANSTCSTPAYLLWPCLFFCCSLCLLCIFVPAYAWILVLLVTLFLDSSVFQTVHSCTSTLHSSAHLKERNPPPYPPKK